MPFSSVEQLSQKDVNDTRLQQRVHGVIVHGHGRHFYLVDPELISKGANQGSFRRLVIKRFVTLSRAFLVITILTDVVSNIRTTSRFKSTRALSIQFDGASENWNQSLLAWCHLIVAGRAFDEVTIYRESFGVVDCMS